MSEVAKRLRALHFYAPSADYARGIRDRGIGALARPLAMLTLSRFKRQQPVEQTLPHWKMAGDPVDPRAAAAAIDPTSLVTVIYTSGTTGPPKGVMLDHTNVLAAYDGLVHHIGAEGGRHRLVSYLPMAHIAERMVSHYDHMLWGSQVTPCAA